MEIAAAQRNMALSYAGGAPGVLVSGLVWMAAGIIWQQSDVARAFLVLFIGGMIIFPASVLIARLILRAPKISAGNPLERLGLETTFMLFGGILIAWLLLRPAPDLVFPVMAITIGVRYFAFRTLYADPLYWVLGVLLASAGALAALGVAVLPTNIAIIAGGIEIGFAIMLFARRNRLG